MIKKVIVNLAEIEESNFLGSDGQEIRGYRLKFVTEKGEYLILWSESKLYEDKVTGSGDYVPSKAFEITLQDKIFNNRVTWRLARP